MLYKLLRQHISVPQMLGYSLAALVGMSIIFSAFCFYMDIRSLFMSSDSLFKNEYVLVNKSVTFLSALNSKQSTFSTGEIEEIKNQAFVKSVYCFTPCNFRVQAYTNPSSVIPALSTELFFESVPDKLLDTQTNDWHWSETSLFIPIILPRNYLNLYNFGFAGSQGLPQISEGIIQKIMFKVAITGRNGVSETFNGRIVGFSDYLNTILVPESFMKQANQKFGSSNNSEKISRIIVEVKNPADPTISQFFSEKNYETGSNTGDKGKLSFFLRILVLIVIGVGCLVMLTAIYLLFLSINLLIHKNERAFSNLILLAYTRSSLALPYSILILSINVTVGAISLFLTQVVQAFYADKLHLLGIQQQSLSSIWGTAGLAVVFVLVLSLLDVLWIRYRINNIRPPYRG